MDTSWTERILIQIIDDENIQSAKKALDHISTSTDNNNLILQEQL